MFNFKKMLAQAYTKGDYIERELGYSEANAQIFFNLVKEYYQKNGDEVSSSDISQDFMSFFERLNESVVRMPTIKSDTIRYNAVRSLMEKPSMIRELYDEIIEEEKQDGAEGYQIGDAYVADRRIAMKTAVMQALSEMRYNKENIDKNNVYIIKELLKHPKKEQNEYRRALPRASRDYVDLLTQYFKGTEFDQVKAYLERIYPNLETLLKDKIINSLTYLGQKFDELGLLDKYANLQDRTLKSMYLEELAYPLEILEESKESEDSKNPKNPKEQITIRQIFDPEVLSTLDFKKLSMLNAFWVNRFTKELDNINTTHFIVDSLNLWSQIERAEPDPKTGKIHIPVDEKELKMLYKKMAFLKIASDQMMRYFTEGSNEYEVEEVKIPKEDGTFNVIRRFRTDECIEEMRRDLSPSYREEFNREAPELYHNFGEDFDKFRILENSKFNAYKVKDYSLIGTLANLYEKGHSGNWGVILDSDGTIGKGKMMLLGIDVEGLNMPIRLHIQKSVVKDFIESYQKTTYFPVYEGGNDYEYIGQNIPTHILAPVSTAYRKSLVSAIDKQPKGTLKQNLLEHLSYLVDFRKYPEHLKVDKIEKKKNKIKTKRVKPETRYVDLSANDGKLYVQDSKGEYKEKIDVKKSKEESEK